MSLRAAGAIALMAMMLGACSGESAPPQVLHVSAIPDQTQDHVRAQHVPIIEIVCPAVGIRCEWVPIATYPELIEALGNGRVDVAFLGGVSYVRARDRHGVLPLAIRDVDIRFSSAIVVRTGAKARQLRDLAGATFSFGNRASTSGHVMARHFLAREGIQPEVFFARIDYAENHDRTLDAVASGKADAGVTNSAIAMRALARGGQYNGVLRVVWESPTYLDYVWAARPGIPSQTRERLIDAFLDVNVELPRHAAALRAHGAGGFLPAQEQEYRAVAAAMQAAGIR